MQYDQILRILFAPITGPELIISMLLVLTAAAILLFYSASAFNFGSPTYSEPSTPSVDDIENDEVRLRAEAKKLHAQAERDEALLKAETARVSLEDIRSIIKHERRR